MSVGVALMFFAVALLAANATVLAWSIRNRTLLARRLSIEVRPMLVRRERSLLLARMSSIPESGAWTATAPPELTLPAPGLFGYLTGYPGFKPMPLQAQKDGSGFRLADIAIENRDIMVSALLSKLRETDDLLVVHTPAVRRQTPAQRIRDSWPGIMAARALTNVAYACGVADTTMYLFTNRPVDLGPLGPTIIVSAHPDRTAHELAGVLDAVRIAEARRVVSNDDFVVTGPLLGGYHLYDLAGTITGRVDEVVFEFESLVVKDLQERRAAYGSVRIAIAHSDPEVARRLATSVASLPIWRKQPHLSGEMAVGWTPHGVSDGVVRMTLFVTTRHSTSAPNLAAEQRALWTDFA